MAENLKSPKPEFVDNTNPKGEGSLKSSRKTGKIESGTDMLRKNIKGQGNPAESK